MTTIVRWNPIRDLRAVERMMDRLFDNALRAENGGWYATEQAMALRVDVYETAKAYTVIAAVPGATAEQISINLQDNVLTLSGEIPAPAFGENTRTILSERAYGKFYRTLHLPEVVDRDHIEAVLEHGVLTLTLPKVPEAQPRVIPIRTSNGALSSSN